ncbi:MAG: Uma2 family endonuclease [Xanthobacteraceae bacterium]
MNIALPRAADGLPRRPFSVSDIHRMIEAGVLGEHERFELIEGDLVMMAAKSVAHDRIKNALNMALAHAAPTDTYVAIEPTFQLAEDILVEPDVAVIARSVYKAPPRSFAQPRPEDVLLLIEVAVSSLAYDRGVKARLYAHYGIREFWVIEASQCVTWVHTGPAGEGWSSIVQRGPDETLTSAALPRFAMTLSAID